MDKTFDPPTPLPPAQTIDQLRTLPEAETMIDAYQHIVLLAERIRDAGGQAVLVGGAVRAELLKTRPTDFDVEVHGLNEQELEKILTALGPYAVVGKSFATYTLPLAFATHVSLPRRDEKTGHHHADFHITVDPRIGLTEAARRRDFTIGAIMKDILTGAYIDPFHGIAELNEHRLRLVDLQTFPDDALRVFRGARFVAEYGLQVEPETLSAMRSMIERISFLSADRLREEWRRLLHASRPSLGLRLLYELGVLARYYPELAALWSTSTDIDRYPEGTVGAHTELAIDAAAAIVQEQDMLADQREHVLAATLLHDIGKPLVTTLRDGRVVAPHHERAAAGPIAMFGHRLGWSSRHIDHIIRLVAFHLLPVELYAQRDSLADSRLRLLSATVGPAHVREVIAVAEADHRGRGPFGAGNQKKYPDTGLFRRWWNAAIERLALDAPITPLLTGRDLLEAGWPAGPEVGQAIRLSETLAIYGVPRTDILRSVRSGDAPAKTVQELEHWVTSLASTTGATAADGIDSATVAGQ